MRPGIRTTEFWLTLGHLLVTLLVTGGVVAVSDTSKLEGALTDLVTAVFGIVTAGGVIIHYVRERSRLKEMEGIEIVEQDTTVEE